MVLLSGEGGANAPIIINSLKDLGVSEGAYTFRRLGKAAGSIGEMASVAMLFALVMVVCMFAWRAAGGAYRTVNAAYAQSRTHLSAEAERRRLAAIAAAGLASADGATSSMAKARAVAAANAASASASYASAEKRKRAVAIRIALTAVFVPLCVTAALLLVRQILSICITWQEIPFLINMNASAFDPFSGRLNALGEYQATAISLLAASVVSSAAAVFIME
jgi:hypothetical protein